MRLSSSLSIEKILLMGLGTTLSSVNVLPAQANDITWSSLGDVNLVDSQTFQLSTDGGLDDDIDLGVLSGTFNFSGSPAQDNSFGELEAFLELDDGALDIGGEAFEGSVIKTLIDVQSGDKLSFDWQFVTNETADELSGGRGLLNDYAFIVLDDQVTTLADVSNASLDSGFFDQETGLQPYNFQFSQAGSVSLALGVVDIDDFLVTSGLSVENLMITSSPNLQPVPEPNHLFGLITILGFGFLTVKKR